MVVVGALALPRRPTSASTWLLHSSSPRDAPSPCNHLLLFTHCCTPTWDFSHLADCSSHSLSCSSALPIAFELNSKLQCFRGEGRFPTSPSAGFLSNMSERRVDGSFYSHPTTPLEMPPPWVLLVGLGFCILALGFWV